jgi:hypothetical protein
MAVDTLEDFKRLVIVAIFSEPNLRQSLVLKGGNLLDMVYGISSRPSKDIDLSMCGELQNPEETRCAIERSLQSTFGEHGYVVFDVTLTEEPPSPTDDMRDFWGGYRIYFKIIKKKQYDRLDNDLEPIRKRATPLRAGGSTKFPIEISKYEYCDGKEERSLDGCTIYVYTPAMLVCEKLRAICQQMPEYAQVVPRTGRPRGRDFLDIHTVTEFFRIDFISSGFHDVLRSMFEVKRVPLRLLGLIATSDVREFHRPDFISIVDTVKPDAEVQSYEFYYEYVVAKCRSLESLWNE